MKTAEQKMKEGITKTSQKLLPKSLSIFIPGIVPSKKNNKRAFNTKNSKKKVILPSKEYINWENMAIVECNKFMIGAFIFEPFEKVEIALTLMFPDERERDPDNALTSILDMFQKARVIKKDCWKRLPKITITSFLDKDNPGAHICIKEVI